VKLCSLAIAAVLAAALLPAASASRRRGRRRERRSRAMGIGVGMATREAAEQAALGECGVLLQAEYTARPSAWPMPTARTGRAEGFSAGATLQQVEQPAWAECNANVPANSCKLQAAGAFSRRRRRASALELDRMDFVEPLAASWRFGEHPEGGAPPLPSTSRVPLRARPALLSTTTAAGRALVPGARYAQTRATP